MIGRIFVGGPMSGIPAWNFPAFNDAERRLVLKGWAVENPASTGVHPEFSWEDYLRLSIAQLLLCDSIYLLRGWEKSKGALLETHVADALGMTFFYQGEKD